MTYQLKETILNKCLNAANLKCSQTLFKVSQHRPDFQGLVDSVLDRLRGIKIFCFLGRNCCCFLYGNIKIFKTLNTFYINKDLITHR